MEVIKSLICKKDWIMNNDHVFKKGWTYPAYDHYIQGDELIQGFKIFSGDYGVWFWSGSNYFEIEYLS